MQQEEDGAFSAASAGAWRPPEGSLLLRSPQRPKANNAAKPLHKHYRALLLGEDVDVYGDASTRIDTRLNPASANSEPGSTWRTLSGPSDLRRHRSEKGGATKDALGNGIFSKYKANIVPKGMRRPPHTYLEEDLNPRRQPVAEILHERARSGFHGDLYPETNNDVSAPREHNGYFSPSERSAFDEEYDTLPPTYHEQRRQQQQQQQPQETPATDVADAGSAFAHEDNDVEQDVEQQGDEGDEHDFLSFSRHSRDNGFCADGETERGSEYADANEGASATDEQLSSKYIQIISNLSDELESAQDRVHELEQEREEQQKELEQELEELDKGNLDLKGQVVTLQRQVLKLTSERQEHLVEVQQLTEENARIRDDFSKMEEIAKALHAKASILQRKLQESQGKTSKWGADQVTNEKKAKGSIETFQHALERIEELEALSAALRESKKQQRHLM